MKKLLLILSIAVLASCTHEAYIFDYTQFQDPKTMDFCFTVNQRELRQVKRQFHRRDSSQVKSEYLVMKLHIVCLTYDQVTATRKNKGKYSILSKKYDERINKSIKNNLQ